MKIVIDIPDEDYKRIKDMPDAFNSLTSRTYKSIRNGTPLLKGHGDLIDRKSISYENTCVVWSAEQGDILECNAPTIIKADKEVENG